MNNYQLPKNTNSVDNMSDALVEVLPYADQSVSYPDTEKIKPDDGVIAEWFYPIYNGMNDFSELTAILMYTSQKSEFEEIGELMLGIGLVEMKHYSVLGEVIKQLGGRVDQRTNNSGVKIGKTPREALQIAIQAEVKTIDFYNSIIEKLERVKTTVSVTLMLQTLSKFIADEERHKQLLEEKLAEYSKREQTEREKLEDIENE